MTRKTIDIIVPSVAFLLILALVAYDSHSIYLRNQEVPEHQVTYETEYRLYSTYQLDQEVPRHLVTVQTEFSVYPVGTKELSVSWENNSNGRIACEYSFLLLKLVDGSWEVELPAVYVFFRPKFLVSAGEKVIHNYPFEKDEAPYSLSEGQYRFATPYWSGSEGGRKLTFVEIFFTVGYAEAE